MKRLFLFLIFLPVAAFAFGPVNYHCPAPGALHVTCTVTFGKKHCQWEANWYEGFIVGKSHGGHYATQLVATGWSSKHFADKSKLGSTACFYKTDAGTQVVLVQNDYGGVARPKLNSGAWYLTNYEGHKMLSCSGSCPIHMG